MISGERWIAVDALFCPRIESSTGCAASAEATDHGCMSWLNRTARDARAAVGDGPRQYPSCWRIKFTDDLSPWT